jgi:diguanylate cyclase (GGDEF)-like protein
MALSNIFSHLVELTSNVTDAYATVLYSADNENETYHLKEFFSLNPDLKPPATVPFDDGPISKAVASQKPLVIDYFNPEAAKLKVFKKIADLKSFLLVPVIHNELEGVLLITTKEAYSFSSKLQKIVSGLAEQIAWNLSEKVQSIPPSENAESSLMEMNTYLHSLGESPDKDTLVKRLVEIPSSIMKCDAIAIVRFDANGVGEVWEHRGFAKNPSLYNLRLGRGIVGLCAKSRTPIIHTTIERTLMAIFSSNENTEAIKSVATTPILHNKHMFGVLVAGSSALNGLSRNDLNKLTLIASGAASSLTFLKTKHQLENEKNRDPITGIYNHRFLMNYHRAVSKKIFDGSSPVFFLTIQLTNLPSLYEAHGMRNGDFILRRLVSLISKKVPSPRNIFKYSDNSLLVMILKRNRDEVENLEARLKNLFNDYPLSVNEVPIQLKTSWGLSSYPDESDDLHELIGLSSARATQPSKVTH